MEKALVSGELAEEESMFEMERDQLSDVTHSNRHSNKMMFKNGIQKIR